MIQNYKKKKNNSFKKKINLNKRVNSRKNNNKHKTIKFEKKKSNKNLNFKNNSNLLTKKNSKKGGAQTAESMIDQQEKREESAVPTEKDVPLVSTKEVGELPSGDNQLPDVQQTDGALTMEEAATVPTGEQDQLPYGASPEVGQESDPTNEVESPVSSTVERNQGAVFPVSKGDDDSPKEDDDSSKEDDDSPKEDDNSPKEAGQAKPVAGTNQTPNSASSEQPNGVPQSENKSSNEKSKEPNLNQDLKKKIDEIGSYLGVDGTCQNVTIPALDDWRKNTSNMPNKARGGPNDGNIMLAKLLFEVIADPSNSSIDFARNPQNVANSSSIGYEWVPQGDNDKGKVPTNLNLLMQRLFLLSAIPLNNNEKRLFEQLILSYQDEKYFNDDFREVMGIKPP